MSALAVRRAELAVIRCARAVADADRQQFLAAMEALEAALARLDRALEARRAERR